jgi:hypothetical protein
LTAISTLPDWIKKAKRSWKAKVKRYSVKHNISLQDADNLLNEALENNMQEL